ncbi:MAG TPA: hypothetical protein VH637_24905, partial [Streptosporangiaceae bacterium]
MTISSTGPRILQRHRRFRASARQLPPRRGIPGIVGQTGSAEATAAASVRVGASMRQIDEAGLMAVCQAGGVVAS